MYKHKLIGIYSIENNINHKIYIGQSINIYRRWVKHKFDGRKGKTSSHLLYRDMYEYGVENFTLSILELCSKEELDFKEKYYIDKYNSTNPNYGYNIASGGRYNAKLTDKEVLSIMKLLPYKTQSEISSMFNVDQSVISRINKGYEYRFDDIEYPICSDEFYYKKIKKPDNHCIDCGKKICRTVNRCRECSNEYLRSKRIKRSFPTRDELKELIRNTPFTRIGEMYGVTDNAIRKWCLSMNLPTRKKDIDSYTDSQWNLL